MNKDIKQLAEEMFNKHSWAAIGAISPSKSFIIPAMVEMYTAGAREATTTPQQEEATPLTRAWCKGYEKATLKFAPLLNQLQERIKELESKGDSSKEAGKQNN